ncbi:hypothetical protein DLM45_10915 [Hyphomicrobium methylovorum]|uniref:CinA family protein n=1 Tax=Hyphomicrobium methylovorum TaxID=84 RepID=UPI0015E76098|nr:CinA family protein [Hyphomicrobium methylovorum]MBA2126723.1 hypothetical protein [Hyphomicrobium methylovorum]
MVSTVPLVELAERVIALCQARNERLVTAESCTAGSLSTLLSDIPGAGEILEGGFVSYAKSFKADVLGVDEGLLEQESAVCTPVALAMSYGALARSTDATLAVSITGVCGPKPDEDDNPVGLAYLAVVYRTGKENVIKLELDRHLSNGHLRGQMLGAALALLVETLTAEN